jgi:TM2 domain-containing membrane protein YozV/cold shock CspA family protein
LQPDDLLWKRGFDDWKAASSIPGLLNPPGSPGEKLPAAQPGGQEEGVMPNISPAKNMRGKVLFYDNATANGIISGDDGRRYAFQRGSVGNGHEMLRSGQEVDFEISENQAANIYVLGGGSGQVGKKSKVAAGLLDIFLGGLGIHKFYIGANGTGFIMLVTWLVGWAIAGIPTAIMSIIGIIEGIIYLTQSDEGFYRTYEVGKKSWF